MLLIWSSSLVFYFFYRTRLPLDFNYCVLSCLLKQGQDCFICKQQGHRAKDCPEKSRVEPRSSKICLKCGESGHDMFACRNDYSHDDLKVHDSSVCVCISRVFF